MVTQVQIGNFFNSGGRTIVGGVGGSGLDTESLIKALTDAKRLSAVRLEDKLKLNSQKNAALTQFRTLLANFKDAMNFLRNPPGVGNAADNIFRYVNGTATSNTSVAGSTYVGVTVAPGAAIQSYTIKDITSVAKAKKQTTALFSIANADTSVVSGSPAGVQFKAGTFTLKDREITFVEGDSLNTVAAKINAESANTGIVASIIRVGEGSYQLSFSANATGTDANFDFNNADVADTLIDDDDVFDLVTISTEQQASNAVFKFNGASITRQNNTINDIVSGLTINILQQTPDEPDPTEITVGVNPDSQVIKGGIINFINAYNELKVFVANQNRLNPDGSYAEDAVLNNSSVLRTTLAGITSQLSSIVSGITGGGVNRLADIGIVSADLPESEDNPLVRNILNVDESKLEAAISGNYEGVRKIFEFDFVTNNPNLRNFSRTNSLRVNNFSLAINPYETQTTKVYEVVDADTPIVATSPDTNQLKEGSVIINGIAIDLVDGDTLNQVAQKFNDVSGSTGVTAEVVETEPNKFKLKFTSIINGVNTNLLSSSVNPNGVFTDAGITSVGTIKATYTTDSGPVTVDLDANYVTSSTGVRSGIRITGRAGTELEGLVMVYAGTLSSTVSVSLSQGIADKVFNNVDAVLLDDNGPLDVEIQTLKTADAKYNDDIRKIDEQVERFRQELISKFGALEQAIAKVNTLLQSIDAQQKALYGSNN